MRHFELVLNKPFIRVYYIESPSRIRGFLCEVHDFQQSNGLGLCLGHGPDHGHELDLNLGLGISFDLSLLRPWQYGVANRE